MRPGQGSVGEQCYLKADQDASCRLFGCDQAWMQVFVLPIEGQPRVGFCKRHARQYATNEIHVVGIAGKPVSPPA